MKTPPTPTIAELWDQFQKLFDYIETEKILHSWGTKGSDGLSHDGRNHSADEAELNTLRQQLVDRCANDHGLSIEDGGDVLRIVRDRLHFVTVCGSYHARNEGSAWLFIGWELDQRQREATNA